MSISLFNVFSHCSYTLINHASMDIKTITMSLSLFNVFPYCSYQFLLIYESCFYHAFMHMETITMSISLFNGFSLLYLLIYKSCFYAYEDNNDVHFVV